MKKLQLLSYSAILGLASITLLGCSQVGSAMKSKSLAELKSEYKTQLIKTGPNPESYDNTPPRGAEVIHYESDGRKLLAWVMKPDIKGKRPAVLFAHGGDSLGAADANSILPFLNTGSLVMLPSWRGENGNPGNYELCYGEVEDAKNAVEYLKSRPDVDPSLIFAAGHSIGGTVVMLLAESSDSIKKAAACGGLPSMETLFGGYPGAPYKDTRKEKNLRSPREHIEDLKCPLLLLYGDEGRGEKRMYKLAQSLKRISDKQKGNPEVKVMQLKGTDHFTALSQAMAPMVKFFSSN